MKERLKYYVDVKHNVFTVDCENCSYKAGKKYLLEKDILLHHKKVSFDCHIFQHKNNSKDALNCHIKKEHKGLRRYECHECDGLCTGKQGVRRHVESVHTGLKFDCDMCEFMIELNSGWRCMQCGKGSKNKTLLKMHFKSEHMGIAHTCEDTNTTFQIRFTDGACKVKSLAIIDSISVDHLMTLNATIVLIYSEL